MRIMTAACAAFGVACAQPAAILDDLEVQLRVDPDVVQPGDSLQATLVITNPTRQDITLSSGSSCVATPAVFQNGARAHFKGTALGCLTVVSYFPIPAGDSLVAAYDLVALMQQQQEPWSYVDPPAPSVYHVRAHMQVQLPDASAEFRVAQAASATAPR